MAGLRSLLLMLACCALLRAQAGLLVPTASGRPDASVLSLREMAVDLELGRGYARVNVHQVFENHTGTSQEATYRFALPPSAAVGDFAVWDGLQRIPGVILEKRRARSIYQELERQRIDPGLLQQGEEEDLQPAQRGGLFSVAVTPIPALATKRLELQFQQEVPYLGGLGEFRLALRPADAEPPVAGLLTVRVRLADATLESGGGLALRPTPEGAAFSGRGVKLDQDLVVRFRPRDSAPLRLTAFRNAEGMLPDGLALAPWERPSEIPPEKDGFFLLEALPPTAGGARPPARAAGAGPDLAILFDTGLGHRWNGLETAYGQLVRVLQTLGPDTRFALIPYDRTPATAALRPATAEAVQEALAALRARPLGPGSDLPLALAAARKLLDGRGRILLLTGSAVPARAKALREAAGGARLFTCVSAGEVSPQLVAASTQVLQPTATELEGDLFFQGLLEPGPPPAPQTPASSAPASRAPFTVTGGSPGLRDIYAVLVQPMQPGSLSGWVGRYTGPGANLTFELPSALFPGGRSTLRGTLPERALDARDLPRRWARARVDDLLGRIEADGERRDWIEEVIALSKRYKFVTPYTAFLAAPRALLRPRRIQPGDPVLRVECDPATVSATALFPFGLKLDLVRRPGGSTWEGRFLVPEGLRDGRYAVRILVRDASGARASETKHFILDGKTPIIRPQLPASGRAGTMVRIAATADADVVFLSARVGDGAPVPLRWDAAARQCVGLVWLPPGSAGSREVLFEAVDAARNRGFQRAMLQVRP
jgi:Ca-activated chloride channel family protein